MHHRLSASSSARGNVPFMQYSCRQRCNPSAVCIPQQIGKAWIYFVCQSITLLSLIWQVISRSLDRQICSTLCKPSTGAVDVPELHAYIGSVKLYRINILPDRSLKSTSHGNLFSISKIILIVCSCLFFGAASCNSQLLADARPTEWKRRHSSSGPRDDKPRLLMPPLDLGFRGRVQLDSAQNDWTQNYQSDQSVKWDPVNGPIYDPSPVAAAQRAPPVNSLTLTGTNHEKHPYETDLSGIKVHDISTNNHARSTHSKHDSVPFNPVAPSDRVDGYYDRSNPSESNRQLGYQAPRQVQQSHWNVPVNTYARSDPYQNAYAQSNRIPQAPSPIYHPNGPVDPMMGYPYPYGYGPLPPPPMLSANNYPVQNPYASTWSGNPYAPDSRQFHAYNNPPTVSSNIPSWYGAYPQPAWHSPWSGAPPPGLQSNVPNGATSSHRPVSSHNAVGHPSNYREISEDELNRRVEEYQGNRGFQNDLSLPELPAIADAQVNVGKGKASRSTSPDRGLLLSGNSNHDRTVQNFQKLASGWSHIGARTLFDEIDTNKDGVIKLEELRNFLWLHEVALPH